MGFDPSIVSQIGLLEFRLSVSLFEGVNQRPSQIKVSLRFSHLMKYIKYCFFREIMKTHFTAGRGRKSHMKRDGHIPEIEMAFMLTILFT